MSGPYWRGMMWTIETIESCLFRVKFCKRKWTKTKHPKNPWSMNYFFHDCIFVIYFPLLYLKKHTERMQGIQTMAARVLPKIRMRDESYTMCLMISASVYYFTEIYCIIQTPFIYTQFQFRPSSSCLPCLLAKSPQVMWTAVLTKVALSERRQLQECSLHHTCTITVN